MMKQNAKAYLAMTIAMTTVGSSFVVGKWIVNSMPVFLASGIRYGLASIVLLLLLFYKEKSFPKINKKDVFWLFLQSFTGVFGFSVCMLYGLKYTSAMESGIITSTGPMVIALISFLFLKEHLSSRHWLGVFLAVCGITAIQLLNGGSGEVTPGVPTWIGSMLIFGAVIGESLFTIFGKVLSERLSALAIATFVTVFGFVMFLPFAIYEAITFDFTQPSMLAWMSIVYYALIVTVVGFVLWYYGVSKVPASTSGVFTAIISVSALLLSSLFLNEELQWGHVVGVLFVLFGIFITATSRQKDASASHSITG